MKLIRVFSLLFSASCLLSLVGCSVPGSVVVSTGSSQGVSGTVLGGLLPVANASVQLYAVGTTGDGSAATAMLAQPVVTDANGAFRFALPTCANAGPVYLVASGGKAVAAGANTNLTMMTALGPCASLTAGMTVTINELTTVGAVGALAPYMSSATGIGSSPTDETALVDAFSLATQFVNSATGASPGQNVPAGTSAPTAMLNTLADIVEPCVDSTGGVAGDGSACGKLFSLATPPGGTAPTNVAAALLNVMNDPTQSTAGLFQLAPSAGPFQPQLTTAPASFSPELTPSGSSFTLQVSPSSLSFPSTTVGVTSAAQTITLQNHGASPIAIDSITVTGLEAGDFQLTTGCGASVGAGSSCTLQVTFRPGAIGFRSAAVLILSGAIPTLQYVGMTGTGIAGAPAVTLSKTSITFPAQTVGTSSSAMTATVTNSGTAPLTVSSVSVMGAVSGNFTETNNCSTVAVGGSCTISVVFSPSATGSQSASVKIVSNAASSPNTIAVSGTATAGAPLTGVSSSLVTFLYGGVTRDVTLNNTSSSPLTINGMTTSTPYFSATNNCGGSIAAGGSCTVSILNSSPITELNPANQYGGGLATSVDVLTISTSDSAGPRAIYLVSNSSEMLSPESVVFAPTAIGSSSTTTITLSEGTAPGSELPGTLVVQGADAADFTATAGPVCAMQNLPGCNIAVVFTPGGSGTRTAQLVVDSQGDYIPLTGSGVGSVPASSLGFSPTSATVADFVPQTITVTNSSLSAVTISSVTPTTGFTVTNGCGSQLLAQSTCTLTVNSPRTIAGGSQGLLTVTGSFGTETIPLAVQIDPIVQFGNWAVGKTSTLPISFSASVNGYGNLAAVVAGADPGDFSAPGCALRPNTCSFNATFTPSATGQRNATLEVTVTPPTPPAPAYYFLEGTGVVAGDGVYFDLPDGLRGTMKNGAGYQFYVYNSGTTALTFLGNPVITGTNAAEFTLETGSGSNCTSLAVGGSCTLTYLVQPTGYGLRTATVTLNTASGKSFSTPVTMLSVPDAPVASPSQLNFPVTGLGQTSAAGSFTVTSEMNHAISASSSSSAIHLTKASCAEGETPCLITGVFAPTVDGAVTATVTFTDIDTGLTGTATAYGFGGPGAVASISPGSLTFTTRPAGTTSIAQTVTLTDTGDDVIYFQGITITGTNASEFTLTNNTCPPVAGLAAGASCTMSVVFAPASAGSKSAALSISGNGGQGEGATNLPAAISLAGVAQ